MIINPLKVWVQNILPVVYDDSLSYLEVVAKINAKTNEIITQTNENTHAIESLAEIIAQLGDIEELRALLDEIETIIEDLYTTDAPLMDGTASAGSANHAARSDHVHPSDTTKAPINHASSDNTYGIGDANNYGHVKISDNINNNDNGTAIKPSVVKTINEKLNGYSKLNFVDNPYFGIGLLPINQMKSQNYYNAGITVDRWELFIAGHIEVSNDGLKCSSNNRGLFFGQKIDNYNALLSKTVTISAIIDGTLVERTIAVPDELSADAYVGALSTDVNGLQIGLRTRGTDLYFVFFARANYEVGTVVTITAVKLEIGSAQTLAHKEAEVWVVNEIPNYNIELLKCQRYLQLFRTESLRPAYGIDCRPNMAVDEPTKGTETIGGVTYYTLRA